MLEKLIDKKSSRDILKNVHIYTDNKKNHSGCASLITEVTDSYIAVRKTSIKNVDDIDILINSDFKPSKSDMYPNLDKIFNVECEKMTINNFKTFAKIHMGAFKEADLKVKVVDKELAIAGKDDHDYLAIFGTSFAKVLKVMFKTFPETVTLEYASETRPIKITYTYGYDTYEILVSPIRAH